ncbi:MAG: hypothetical protein SOW66_02115 [Porphyromonas sp.]|nr:hypothetical protein [Porphyromonas sp.]
MKRILRILLLMTLCCTSAYARTNADSLLYAQFRDNFRPAEGDSITFESFYRTKGFNDMEPIDKYKALIPLGTIGSEESGISWQAGVRLTVGDFDVLHYKLWHSSPKTLYGPMWVDQLVAVYTRSGKLVDSRIIVRLHDDYNGEIKGTSKPYKLDVKHIQVIGSDFHKRLAFYRSYSISPQGKIDMSYTPAPSTVYSEIQTARPWPKGKLTNDYLYDYDNINSWEDRMSSLFSGYYMPIPDDIHHWEWRWGVRHNDKNYTLLLTPASSDRLGTEISAKDIYVLTTIDKQGRVIDQRILGRNTPQERTLITSDRPDAITIDHYSLSFRDSYTLDNEAKHSRSLYRIDAQGRISVERLFTDQPVASNEVP